MKELLKDVMCSAKLFLILILAVVVIGVVNVSAETEEVKTYRVIDVADEYKNLKHIYTTDEEKETIQIDGVTYDETTNTLTLENAHLDNLYFSRVGAKIKLIGENIIEDIVVFASSNITFVGDGSLTLGYIDTRALDTITELNLAVCVKFDMAGTVTALKGIGGDYDNNLAEQYGISDYSSLVLGENVEIVEGGSIKTEDNITFIGYEETTRKDYLKNKVVIKGKEVTTPDEEEIHTIENGNVSFTSKDELDSDYILSIEDKMSSLTDEEVAVIEKIIKDSHLVFLYDISVVDGNGDVVPMSDGEYLIRLKLSDDALEKYNKFSVVYVNEDGEAEETLDTEVNGSYVEFKTTHLSNYGVLGFNSETIPPATSDNIMMAFIMMIISLCGFVVSFTSLRKRFN